MAEPNIQRRKIRVGSARIYFQEVGSGPAVILIHGLSGSGRWWQKNIPFLARHFRVFVIDLVGFGRSEGERGFVLQDTAAHLRAWMDHLSLETAHVIGHSLGGIVALDLAGTSPDRRCGSSRR